MDSYHLANIVKYSTYYGSSKPRCIDLILTNRKHSCKNATNYETELSDFHKMILTEFYRRLFKEESKNN